METKIGTAVHEEFIVSVSVAKDEGYKALVAISNFGKIYYASGRFGKFHWEEVPCPIAQIKKEKDV